MLLKTNSGFELELSEDFFDDDELMRDIIAAENGDIRAMIRVEDRVFSKEDLARLYDHLRTENGKIPMSAVQKAIGELIQSSVAGKNSSSSPN